MELGEQYLAIMIVLGLAFLLSLVVFFKIQRKWLGCILQLLSFIGLSLILIFILAMFGTCQEASEGTEAMVGVRWVEETRDCRYERTWWIKPDNTYFLVFDKESNSHRIEPCGNDHYGDKGHFTRVDSIYAIKTDNNPQFIIYFNLDSQIVTPVWDKDTLQVVSVDWARIKDYFKNH